MISKAETVEAYQYLRSGKNYYSFAVKSSVQLTAGRESYFVNVKYVGNAPGSGTPTFVFRFADGQTLGARLQLLKTAKTDDVNMIVRHYRLSLTKAQVSQLQALPLKNLELKLIDKTAVSIPVNDELLMQTQFNCLLQ